ncbi:hypothetical protein FDB61_15625 [Clostridium botulinum]|nr:hypothetical protein [Clostridium botulinum]NFL43116.1 hypothetical protein [Clostridium botulinum]
MEIKNSQQFIEIRDSQNAREIATREGLVEVVNKFQNENKEYTIFSIQDENDGSPWYVTYGIRWANNIGYYVLEGNFTLLEDIDL